DDLAVTTIVNRAVTATVPVYEPEVGEPVNATLATPPAFGTAVVATNGSFTYTPNAGFAGKDAFTIEACEVSREIGCDDGTVTGTVTPIANTDPTNTMPDPHA